MAMIDAASMARTMMMIGGVSLRYWMMIGAASSETRLMTLIIGLRAGPGGVLERVAHRVADDGRLVGVRAFAAVEPVLDQLLGVVPGAAGVGHEDRQELAREDDAGQEPAQGLDLKGQADDERGEHGQQGQADQLLLGGHGADADGLP